MDKNNSTEHLEAAGKKINQAIDNILKISTGALALSITFKSTIMHCARNLSLLHLSWFLFGAVPILYVLLRFLEAKEDLFWWKSFKEVEDAFDRGEESVPLKELPHELKTQHRAARLCFILILICFVVGIISFLWFGIDEATCSTAPIN